MRKLLLGLIAITFLASCSSSNISGKEKQTINVAIDLNNVKDDKVQVSVDPKKIKEDIIIYRIPAIVPGTYGMSDYGKFVSDFKAFNYKGEELTYQRIDTNSWEIKGAKKLDKISYWVDDTFDSKKKHNVYVMSGTNIEEGKNFFLNLPGFVGYFDGKKEYPYEISISHPNDLYETTSLINKNTTLEI